MGPLAGLKVVEFAGLGPAPMAAMLLADMGATVLRIERPNPAEAFEIPEKFDLLRRNRDTLALDLKRPAGLEACLRLIEGADALIEGFRPGAMERLGLGPEVTLQRNPRLVYGRVTGWGREGPLAQTAGHDINFLALTGALAAIGRRDQLPSPPLALVGDFGGGALYLAFGIMCALHEARQSGHGQVVDAAMIDGVASLMTTFFGMHAAGLQSVERGRNLLDSGCAFYDVYECADGRLVALGAVETRFRRILLDILGIPGEPEDGEAMRAALTAAFRRKTRPQWQTLFANTDACLAPVLDMAEAPLHPHNRARGTFVEIDGVTHPAPAPRFSRTQPEMPRPPRTLGAPLAVLERFGLSREDVVSLEEAQLLHGALP